MAGSVDPLENGVGRSAIIPLMSRFDPERATIGFLCAVLVILSVQVIRGPVAHGTPGDVVEEGDPCIGDPINVDYDYNRQMLQPHECKVQCSDDRPRYILYTNGLATQCEDPPGCNDLGEDRGVTCVPAGMSMDQ